MSQPARLIPPPFPTVTIHTEDGAITVPCEPAGDYLAITACFQMLGDETGFESTLPGTFEVRLRSTGRALTTSGGCIACARNYAKLLLESPVDWSAPEEDITKQSRALPSEARMSLAQGRDLAWVCAAEWCDRQGPGVVLIPAG